MHSNEIKMEVVKLREEGKSLAEIGKIMHLPRSTVQKMIKPDKSKHVGPKGRPKIIGFKEKKVIDNSIRIMKKCGERVTSTKILKNTKLKCCSRTVRKHLEQTTYKYRKSTQMIQLTAEMKEKRLGCIKNWFKENINFNSLIFVDEKRFNLDGPDNFMSWNKNNEICSRKKRVMGGGGVMVHGAVGIDGHIRIIRLTQTINGEIYKNILSELSAYLNERYGNYILAQDNARPHTCKLIQAWMQENEIKSLSWPPYSPDFNLIEHIWHMLSEIVYDGPQYKSNDKLWEAIEKATEIINSAKKSVIENMYKNYSDRLFWVLQNDGNIFKSC